MAIAFDNAAGINLSPGATTASQSYTTGGLERALFVGFTTKTTDDISSVTYAGVGMTQAQKIQMATSNRWSYVYYLLNPASGANNIVWTFATNADIVFGGAASYTGVDQAAIDASQTDTDDSVTTLTNSHTTVADNSWVVVHFYTTGANITAGAGANFIATSSDNIATSDSNGAVSPAGVNNQAVTWTGAANGRSLSISFKPSATVADAGRAGRYMTMLGAGQ